MKKIVCLVIIIVFYSCVGNEKKFFDIGDVFVCFFDGICSEWQ